MIILSFIFLILLLTDLVIDLLEEILENPVALVIGVTTIRLLLSVGDLCKRQQVCLSSPTTLDFLASSLEIKAIVRHKNLEYF